MAWTETCKIDFKKQIDHKKEQGVSVRQALKQLSEESDIAIGTLKDWLYEESTKKSREKRVLENQNVNRKRSAHLGDGSFFRFLHFRE